MNSYSELRQMLRVGPVMAQYHPLLPAALPPSVDVAQDAQSVALACDSPEVQTQREVLIREIDERWTDRFAVWRNPFAPCAGDIDSWLPQRLQYVRATIPSQSRVGSILAERFLTGGFDCCILLMVDGLPYLRCEQWPEKPSPCFVDGPSTTVFGFPEITQTSRLVARVNNAGHHRVLGFTYWERERNDLAARIFSGAPLERIRHFPEVLSRLAREDLKGRFVLIIREGLDELVHRRRELGEAELEASVRAIREDLLALVAIVERKKVHGIVSLVSDHGVSIRDERTWRTVHGSGQSWHGRMSEFPPSTPALATPMGPEARQMYCYNPGILCREPRANEAGFHGGLSADESFVPFLMMEVG